MVSDWQNLTESSSKEQNLVAHSMPYRKHQADIQAHMQTDLSRRERCLQTIKEHLAPSWMQCSPTEAIRGRSRINLGIIRWRLQLTKWVIELLLRMHQALMPSPISSATSKFSAVKANRRIRPTRCFSRVQEGSLPRNYCMKRRTWRGKSVLMQQISLPKCDSILVSRKQKGQS